VTTMVLHVSVQPPPFFLEIAGPGGDTVTTVAALQSGTAIAVVGPEGPVGPAGAGLTDGTGISIVGTRIDLNIEELPLA